MVARFNVKSAYNSIYNFADYANSKWSFIWRLCVPPKLKTFTWIVTQKHLRSIYLVPLCGILSSYLIISGMRNVSQLPWFQIFNG